MGLLPLPGACLLREDLAQQRPVHHKGVGQPAISPQV